MPALLAALIALALTTPADAAKRKLRPVCAVGTLTTIEGAGLVCISAPKWVR